MKKNDLVICLKTMQHGRNACGTVLECSNSKTVGVQFEDERTEWVLLKDVELAPKLEIEFSIVKNAFSGKFEKGENAEYVQFSVYKASVRPQNWKKLFGLGCSKAEAIGNLFLNYPFLLRLNLSVTEID